MQVRRSLALTLSLFFFAVQPAPAAVCVNRYLSRADGAKLIVTLLTGKLTYQEAQDLARQHNAISLLDDSGKVLATSIEVKPLRPMPVGCDGRTSGVVIQATFLSVRHITKKLVVKFGSADPVEFEEQTGT